MMLVIELSLESFFDVIDILEPGLDQDFSGIERADAAAADQDHGGGSGCTPEHGLTHQRDEVGIYFPIRLVNRTSH